MLEYLQGLIDFIAAYPNLAYGLCFLAAMLESAPVIGLFIPGSTIIVALSALVPGGTVGFWPLTAAAVAGAVLGDSAAYGVGRRYGRAVLARPLLRRYSGLAERCEAFFAGHGGKSVFVGRFVPAIRAFVPLFAGILGLRLGRFLVSDLLSALIWAPIHVVPGMAIGASLALAGAVAGRLLVFLAVLAVLLFLVAWGVRLLLLRFLPLLADAVERARAWSLAGPGWPRRILRSLLEPGETELSGLLVAAAIVLAGIWLFLGLLEDVAAGDPLVRADVAVYGLLQSIRTPWGDDLMVAITELGDTPVVVAVTLAVLAWLLFRRAWRTAGYWIGAVGLASLFNTTVKLILDRPRPIPDLYEGLGALSFPSGHATVNLALWGFFAYLVARQARLRVRALALANGLAFALLVAFSRLYLGAHWFSDVAAGLAFSTAWVTLLAIAYAHHRPDAVGGRGLLAVAMTAFVVGGAVNVDRHHGADVERYAERHAVETLSAADWAAEGWRRLPSWRIDLKGEIEEPFTVAWLGDPSTIATALDAAGWRAPTPWSLASTLAWLAPNPDPATLPVLPLLADGHAPALVRIRVEPDGGRLVLRLWRSSFAVGEAGAARPILIGAVVTVRLGRMLDFLSLARAEPASNGPRDQLAASLGIGRLVGPAAAQSDPLWDGRLLLLEAPAP
jgi:membrane protein DedA with SNARE-associated domain/membrane-associated phospholipid phosphatase